MRRFFPVLLCAIFLCEDLHAAEPYAGRNTIHSNSGMFIIAGKAMAPVNAPYIFNSANWSALSNIGGRPTKTSMSGTGGAEPQLIKLDPAYLAASAERLRKIIWDQLHLLDANQGKVYVTLLRPTSPPQDIFVMHMRNGRKKSWDYKLEIPEEVRSDYLLRALTHVILLEAANRHPLTELTEVPFWFREGMVAHLRATVMDSVFFDQAQGVSATGRLNQEIEMLRREINRQELYDLEQISWPATLEPGPVTERTYRLSTHGLVAKLLELPGGGKYLGNMIQVQAGYKNWQFAFLHAFQTHFKTLSDFEKWWALTTLELTSGESRPRVASNKESVFQTEFEIDRWQRVTVMYLGNRAANAEWPVEECLLRLTQNLNVPIEWQQGPEGEISREEIPVRDIIQQMEFSLQVPVIEQRVARLFGLQLHSPAELAGLVRDYRLALEKYLVDREASYVVNTFKRNSAPSTVLVTRKVLESLDALDKRREEFHDSLVVPSDSTAAQVANAR